MWSDPTPAAPVEAKPYIFMPSGFYEAQCSMRLRLDHISKLYPEPSSGEPREENTTSRENIQNGNQFEKHVIDLLHISKRVCNPFCGKGNPVEECPGMRALRSALNEACASLSEPSARTGAGQWRDALAQVHIAPPAAISDHIGEHVTLSKSFADLVLVGTRDGKVVVEVVDMKYSPEAQAYHKQQVACYIVYLKKGPLATLLKDVVWQGSIWLPQKHAGREGSTVVGPPDFNFTSVGEAVLRQPITDLPDYLANVEAFFSTKLPKAVGDGWPLWRKVRDDDTLCVGKQGALKLSWTDVEDLDWHYDADLCGHCQHKSTCDSRRDAQLVGR